MKTVVERSYIHDREREGDFASHPTEFGCFPKSHRKSLKDFRQINETIRFVCLKCFSGCSVQKGPKSREGCVGMMQVRNKGQRAWNQWVPHRIQPSLLLTEVGPCVGGRDPTAEEGERRFLTELQDVEDQV